MASKNFFSDLYQTEEQPTGRYALPSAEELRPAPKVAPVQVDAPTKADVIRRATELGVNPRLALSFFTQESGSNWNTKDSPKGAVGGFQVVPDTYKAMMGTYDGQRDPWKNMEAGLRYISYGMKTLGTDDPELLAAGYHAGYDRKDLKAGRIPNTSDGMIRTADYAKSVASRVNGGAKKVSATADDTGRYRDLTPDELAQWQKTSADEPGRYRDLTDDELKTWQTSQADGKRERTWGEAASDTGVQLAEGVNTILGAVPNLVAPEGKVAGFFNENAEHWREKQSEPLKRKIEEADRSITAAGEDGILSQISEAAGQYFSDPALAARFVTTNLPSMIPGIGAAKVAQAAALARGASAARAASVATTAAGGVNSALNAGGARGEAFKDIRDTLIQQGYTPEEAEAKALTDSRVVGAIGAITGYISGKTGLESSLFGKGTTKGALKAGTAAAATELAGEQLEEVAPKVTTNIQASEYDDRSIGKDVGRTIVETGIASGPGAVVGGGVSGYNARQGAQEAQATPADTQPQAETQTPPSAAPATPAAPPAAVTPQQAPTKPSGPLSGAVESVVAEEAAKQNLPRATVSSPDGQITGFVQSYQEDGQGNFQARIVTDDGQVYDLDQNSGVQLAIEKPVSGPLSGAIEKAAPSVSEAAPSVAEEAPSVVEPTAAPASTEAVSSPAQAESVEPAPQTVEPQAEQPSEEIPLDEVPLSDLRARMKVVAAQANEAGADPALAAERKILEREINKRTPKEPTDGRGDTANLRLRNVGGAGAASITPQRGDLEGGGAARAQPDQEREAAAAAPVPGARADLPGAGATAEPGAALKDVAAGRQFSAPKKAEAFIAKNNLTETHEVKQTGKVRFEVKPKGRNEDTTENMRSADSAAVGMAPAAVASEVADTDGPVDSRADAVASEKPARIGKATVVKVNDNKVAAEWQVVDADELEATLSKSDNQYRDRNRADSKAQIGQIANAPDFDLLADSPVMDYGAPTLARDGKTIIGGNGRFAGLRQAYDQGTASEYRKALEAAAERFGVSTEGVKKPVLVRRFKDDVDVRQAAIASNEGGGLKMSALEQAKVDAERMGDMADFIVGDNGELNTAANQPFIRGVLSKMPANQQASFMDADGKLSQEGIQRIRNAVLFRAYGDSPTLSRMVESTDPGLRNVVTALLRVAPKIADVKARIDDGDLYDLDVSEDLIAAVEHLNRLRESGTTVNDFINQISLFGDGPSEETARILRHLDESARSAKAMADFIGAYYDGVIGLGSPKQGSMFGDAETTDKKELLNAAERKTKREEGQQQGLFDQKPARETGREDQGQSEDARADAAGDAAEEVKPAKKAAQKKPEPKKAEKKEKAEPKFSVADQTRQNRPLTKEDTPITALMELLSREPDFFDYKTPVSKDMTGIASEIDPGFKVKEFSSELAKSKRADRIWEITVPSGTRTAKIIQKGDKVWLDVSKTLPGQDLGSRIYAIAAAYAHNNGKVLIGDPAGLSRQAFYRRTENMLSSALKYGTTKHLRPHHAQEIPGEYYRAEGHGGWGDKVRALNWNDGDDVGNIKELIYTAYKSAIDNVPELKNVVYNPEQNRFTTLEGRPFTRDDFEALASKHANRSSGPYSLGSRTAKRAALYNTLLRGQSAEARQRVLDQFGDLLSWGGLSEDLLGIAYSVGPDGVTKAEFGPVHTGFKDDPKAAISRLMEDQTGEAILKHPKLGEVSLVYGNTRAGLAHIAKRRGEAFMQRLPKLLEDGKVYAKEGQNGRVFVGTDTDEAVLRLDFNGQAKTWVVSAYEKYPDLEAAENVPEAKRSQTVEERTEKPLTVDQLKRAVTKGVLGQVIHSMIDAGVVELHATTKTLPKDLGQGVRGIQAVTAPDGKIHLIADSLNADNARAVMLHEMFHRGGENTIGSKRWSDLQGRAASLYRQSEQSSGKAREFFDKARSRVAAAKRQGAVATRMEVEEFMAYAIEEYERAPQSMPAAIRKWVEDVIGYVKAWMVKHYGKQLGQLTPAQLSAIAKFAVIDVAIEKSEEIYGRPAPGLRRMQEKAKAAAAAAYSATGTDDAEDLHATITVDGVERPTTNSNGKPIAQTEEGVENFYEWFGDSAVVDEEGKPLVVYHGTAGDFNIFGGGRGGFYFTDDIKAANEYAKHADGDGSPRVVAAYLSIQNPMVLDRSWYDENVMYDGEPEWEAVDNMIYVAEEAGHDGLVLRGFPDFDGIVTDPGKKVGRRIEREYDQYIAFKRTQIKSAVGNRGTFDTNNPDIRYSVKPDDFDDLNDAQKSFLGKIGPEKPVQKLKDRVAQLTNNLGMRMRQAGVDRYAQLLENDKALHGEETLEGSIADSAWVLARMAPAAGGAVTAMLDNGRIYLDPKEKVIDIKDGTKGLGDTLRKLGSPAEIDRFMGWVAANRSKKLAAEGRENLFTPEEIEAGIKLSNGTLADGKSRSILYANAWKEFQQHRDDVLAIAEQAGIITPEQRKTWSEEFYVPFYRVIDEETVGGPGMTSGLARQQAYKKLKGGKQHLNDLLDNTLLNYHHLLQASLKNQAAVQAMKNAEQLGIAEKTMEAKRDKKASTFVLENGKKQWYNIDDPLTFKAVSALSHPGLNTPLMKAGRAFKRFFTNMTTITPQFVVANALRDTLSAMATSPTSAVPFKTAIKGAMTWNDDHAKARMMASGGAFSFGHVYGQNADEIKASLTGQLRGAKLLNDPKMIPQALLGAWRKYQGVTNAAENMNRAGIWAENQDKGKLKAAFEARDLMDFSAHGDATIVRLMTDLVPFLNARLQGLDKLYRSGFKPGAKAVVGKATKAEKQAFARFGAVVGALSMLSMLLFLKNYDDEDYRKLEDWQRDSYWPVKIGDSMFFIPKPFEVGAIATMTERLLEQFLDPTVGGDKFGKRLGHMLTDTFAFNPIPQMVKPLYELGANEDTFTGRPIEDQGMQKLSPSLRTRPDTTRLADYASRGMEAAMGTVGAGDMAPSPVQLDHMIRGYTGAAGATAVGLADTLWRRASGEELPARRWNEYQPIKRFYKNLADEDNYTRYGTDFYEALKKADRAYADYQHLMKYGQEERAEKVMNEQGDALAKRRWLEGVQRDLSKINAEMKKIQMDKALSAEAKRMELDRLRSMRNLMTETVGKELEKERVAKRASP